MTEQEQGAWGIFLGSDALIAGHVVLSHGHHSNCYVAKERVFRFPRRVSYLCKMLAEHFADEGIEVVIGPAICGAIVAQRVAELLQSDAIAVFAEKDNRVGMVIRRGYGADIAGKKVLIVDDVITTGGTIHEVIDAVQLARGCVAGVGVFCDRGGNTKEDFGGKEYFALCSPGLQSWPANECPLCREGAPVITDFGREGSYLRTQ